MKVILRILFILILLIIAIPSAVVGAILINDTSVPTYIQTFNHEEFNAEEEMNTKLQTVMMSNVLGQKSIKVDEEFMSKLINSYTNGFESYQYQIAEGYDAGIENVWLTFDDDILSMYGRLALNETKTTFTAKLSFEDYEGYTEVKIHTIKLGKLPIPNQLMTYGINKYSETNDIDNLNPYGEVEAEELLITIEDEYINNFFTNTLKSNIIDFESIVFDDQNITLNYEFSSTNPEAVAIDKALTEFKNLITDEAKRASINTRLEQLKSDGKLDEATKESIDSVLNILEAKTKPDSDLSFTDEELQEITDMTSNFSNLTPEQGREVSQVFVDNMDQATIDEITAELSKSEDNKDLTQIINEFLGQKESSTETE